MKTIYTISKAGRILIDGVEVDESKPDSLVYQRHEELLRSGLGPTPITDGKEELEISLSNLKRRYSILISAIPGTQEAIERVVLGEEALPEEIYWERERLKKEYDWLKENLINQSEGTVPVKKN
jgi:hypothetical protein